MTAPGGPARIAIRAALALISVVVIAWLAVMERDVRLQRRGVATAGNVRDAGSLERADSDLRRARLLSPSTAPDVIRAFNFQVHGRRREGIRVLEDVLRREPRNLQAWVVLERLARGFDPAARQRALAAERRLNPIDARSP